MAGELPCARVFEDDRVFAFMDAGQVNPGHVLVASKIPYETFTEADEDTVVAVMRAAHRIARAVERAFEPDGMTLLQANKPAGWQTVPHLHMHILPRYKDDGVELVWPQKNPGIDALRHLAAQIRLDQPV
jgi:histidine triad (HIT) family protein